MIPRLEQTEKGEAFTPEMIEGIDEILNSVFQEELADRKLALDIHGDVYKNEIIMSVSLMEVGNENGMPISYVASTDLKDEKKAAQTIDALVDSAGLFLESFFATEEFDDFLSVWTDIEVKNTTIYYMVSRENFHLTELADNLLK